MMRRVVTITLTVETSFVWHKLTEEFGDFLFDGLARWEYLAAGITRPKRSRFSNRARWPLNPTVSTNTFLMERTVPIGTFLQRGHLQVGILKASG